LRRITTINAAPNVTAPKTMNRMCCKVMTILKALNRSSSRSLIYHHPLTTANH
jgi:hypothetical protein